jgi:hypothetical protein
MVPSALKTVVMLPSQAMTDGATVTANLDTKGASYVVIQVNVSSEEGTDATNATCSLLHADTTDVSNFATVATNLSLDLLTAKNNTYAGRPTKRYLRLAFTAGTGTGSNASVGAVAQLLRLGKGPTNTTDMVNATNAQNVVLF